MTQISLEDLAKGSYHPIAGVFLKYAGELEIVVRQDGYGFHYFIYVGAAKDESNPITEKAVRLFKSLVVELLSFEDDDKSHPLMPCGPRYWVSEGGFRRCSDDRYYATMSLVRLLGGGGICESVHFFLYRTDFNVAIKYAKPVGWNHND